MIFFFSSHKLYQVVLPIDVRLHPDRKINKSLPGYITKHTEKKPDENQTNFTRMNLRFKTR
jgi:hypothetical protein